MPAKWTQRSSEKKKINKATVKKMLKRKQKWLGIYSAHQWRSYGASNNYDKENSVSLMHKVEAGRETQEITQKNVLNTQRNLYIGSNERKHKIWTEIICSLPTTFIFICRFVFYKFSAVIGVDFEIKQGHSFSKKNRQRILPAPGEHEYAFWKGPASVWPALSSSALLSQCSSSHSPLDVWAEVE